MKKILLSVLIAFMAVASHGAVAASKHKPFILASKQPGDLAAVTAQVSAKLTGAGFEIVGTYSPYATTNLIIVTNDVLRQTAAKSEKGGFGAAQRVSITNHNNEIQVAYTNARYMAGVYRMEGDLGSTADTLENVLGKVQEYGMNDGMDDDDLRDYHYMIGMEYFDDLHQLSRYKTYGDAIAGVEKALATGEMGITKVYRIDLPGKDETVFGVAMDGSKGAGKMQDDTYLMSEIDFKDVRSSAHLPYELLVSDHRVQSLSARFRIAINFPDLSMMGANSFMNIMESPDAIKAALIKAAGDHWEKLD